MAALQWIWMHPTLKADILGRLEARLLADKQATGRTGMGLWPILVLGVVRLGLDANYDRLEPIANYDTLLRQMLGVAQTPWGQGAKVFNHQMRIPAAFGHRFRFYPDRIPAASGQQSGTVRTEFRSDPDNVPGHPDSFWRRPEWGSGQGS